MALWVCRKYENVPRAQRIHAVVQHALPTALLSCGTHYAHMSYFVCRHYLYLVHFVCLKIEPTNLRGLALLIVKHEAKVIINLSKEPGCN